MPDPGESGRTVSVREDFSLPTPVVCSPDRIRSVLGHVSDTLPDANDLRARFSDPDGPEILALLSRIRSWPGHELSFRAYEIPASQLDRLLRVFVVQTDPDLHARIDTILQIRMKLRFCALVWQLLQDRCHDPALLSLLFAGAVGRPAFRTGENLRCLEFFRPEDRDSGVPLPERAYKVLVTAQISTDSFFSVNTIDPAGELALEILALYFAACKKVDFLLDASIFARLFDTLRRPDIDAGEVTHLAGFLAPPVGNYLLQLDPPEYDSEQLRTLVFHFGLPDPSRPLWDRLGDEQRTRFAQWLHLDSLRTSLPESRNKVRILAMLYHEIENVISDLESSLLFVYFPRFVLVDRPEEPDTMLLYPRKVFSESYERFVNLRNVRQNPPKLMEADLADELLEDTEDGEDAQDLQAPEALPQLALSQFASQIETQQDSMPNLVPTDHDEPPIISWPIDPSLLVMARIAILETRTERDRRQTLAQSILRGDCDRIIQMRFEDTPILYARQFLYDLLV